MRAAARVILRVTNGIAAPGGLVVEEDAAARCTCRRPRDSSDRAGARRPWRRRRGCAGGTAWFRSAAAPPRRTSRSTTPGRSARSSRGPTRGSPRGAATCRAPTVEAGVLGHVEADAHVALRAEVVDLVGLHRPQHAVERARVVQIAVDQPQAVVGDVRVLVDALEALGVERARPAHDAVDLVPLCEQQLGQVRPVLSGDARDERSLHRSRSPFGCFRSTRPWREARLRKKSRPRSRSARARERRRAVAAAARSACWCPRRSAL